MVGMWIRLVKFTLNVLKCKATVGITRPVDFIVCILIWYLPCNNGTNYSFKMGELYVVYFLFRHSTEGHIDIEVTASGYMKQLQTELGVSLWIIGRTTNFAFFPITVLKMLSEWTTIWTEVMCLPILTNLLKGIQKYVNDLNGIICYFVVQFDLDQLLKFHIRLGGR